jgi:glutathione synthase/RimK-type ligase-like ATP-grasp enzyme
MKKGLTILDFSVYRNTYDPQSNALLAQAARAAGLEAAIANFTRERLPEADTVDVWLRYDIRSRDDLKWVLEAAATLRTRGHRLFPAPKALWVAEDKWETYLVLNQAQIPIPPTFRIRDLKNCGFPLILKPKVGWGGMGNRIVENEDELAQVPPFPREDCICQSYIPHPRTLITAVADEQDIGCIDDRGENAGDDGRTAALATPPEALDLARRALRATGLVTGTVDILESPHGMLVLEVNSAPRLTYPRLPMIDFATPMMAAVLRHLHQT